MKLLQAAKFGSLNLKNRIIMAPLTRSRAKNTIPNALMAEYYKQRSTAGLIISEATQISRIGQGYIDTPGIYKQEHIDAWKQITDAVHKEDGTIVCQLWHVGRSSHPSFLDGDTPVSSSDGPYRGKVKTKDGLLVDKVRPRALSIQEIKQTITDYSQAAKNAIEAGFDGVEIHGANGYLIDQFICDGVNLRTDEYGGSIENRCKFALEVVNACCNAIGNDRVGIRISPSGTFNDMYDSSVVDTFSYLVEKLNDFELAYLHVTEHYNPPGKLYPLPDHYLKADEVTPYFRKIYKGNLITAAGFDKDKGEEFLQREYADGIAYGKLYISNPDLPRKFKEDLELKEWDVKTFYGGDEKGYTDYE